MKQRKAKSRNYHAPWAGCRDESGKKKKRMSFAVKEKKRKLNLLRGWICAYYGILLYGKLCHVMVTVSAFWQNTVRRSAKKAASMTSSNCGKPATSSSSYILHIPRFSSHPLISVQPGCSHPSICLLRQCALFVFVFLSFER